MAGNDGSKVTALIED